jgi:hypothetical protein
MSLETSRVYSSCAIPNNIRRSMALSSLIAWKFFHRSVDKDSKSRPSKGCHFLRQCHVSPLVFLPPSFSDSFSRSLPIHLMVRSSSHEESTSSCIHAAVQDRAKLTFLLSMTRRRHLVLYGEPRSSYLPTLRIDPSIQRRPTKFRGTTMRISRWSIHIWWDAFMRTIARR